jgi:surface protein
VSYTYTVADTVSGAQSDRHQIAIRGTFPRMFLYGNGNAAAITNASNLLSIDQWGDIERQSFAQAFQNASRLSLLASDTPNFKRVKEMTSMFQGATNLTGNFSGWNTSGVEQMNNLFRNATNFNQDLRSWSIASVKNMAGMFYGASNFNQPLEVWDISKVQNMSGMFAGASSFDQDISMWMPQGISLNGFTNFLSEVKLSTFHYNALLSAWSQLTGLVTAQPFNGGKSQYGGCVANAQDGIDGRILLQTGVAQGGKVWVITDGGLDVSCGLPFITTRLVNSDTTTGRTISVPLVVGEAYNFDIDWGDGSESRYVGTTATGISHEYASTGSYQVAIKGIFPRINFANAGDKLKIQSIDQR